MGQWLSNEQRKQLDQMPPPKLPDWLTVPDPPKARPPKESVALMLTRFEMLFPRILDAVYEGSTLDAAMRDLPEGLDLNAGAFFRWLKKDSARYDLYKEAKELRTEIWAGRIIRHATSDDGTEDTSRSKLIIDTYKWLMSADNRKQYGDTKTIEMSSTISITAALAQAHSRVIEAELVQLDEDPLDNLLTAGDDGDDTN